FSSPRVTGAARWPAVGAAGHDAVVSHRVGFARWRSDLPSGGNRYDDEVAAALPRLGVDVRPYAVSGSWPLPAPGDRARLGALLTAERRWLIGNIVASAAPEAVRAATADGRRVTLLVHYFPADDTALTDEQRERVARSEHQTVHAATAVVVTSRWAAEELAARYGRDDAVVPRPGDHARSVAARGHRVRDRARRRGAGRRPDRCPRLGPVRRPGPVGHRPRRDGRAAGAHRGACCGLCRRHEHDVGAAPAGPLAAAVLLLPLVQAAPQPEADEVVVDGLVAPPLTQPPPGQAQGGEVVVLERRPLLVPQDAPGVPAQGASLVPHLEPGLPHVLVGRPTLRAAPAQVPVPAQGLLPLPPLQ